MPTPKPRPVRNPAVGQDIESLQRDMDIQKRRHPPAEPEQYVREFVFTSWYEAYTDE